MEVPVENYYMHLCLKLISADQVIFHFKNAFFNYALLKALL